MLLGVLFGYLLLLLGIFCDGKKIVKYCSVCRVVINEAEWLISQVDPKKSIQVGSFRVDPKGNQNVKDKQYARSEVHIEELLESVCEKMKLYAEIKFDDGSSQMVRTVGFNGERLATKGFKLDRDKGSTFKYKCENFLEDHEEDIIPLLQHENIPNYEWLICGEKLELCSLDELWAPMFALPVAEVETTEGDDEEDAENNVVEDDDDIDIAESDAEKDRIAESNAKKDRIAEGNAKKDKIAEDGAETDMFAEDEDDSPISENVDDKIEL